MATNSKFQPDSPAVQTHLSLIQAVIARMAGNSRSCKTWCITLVSAVLVLVAGTEKSDYVFFAAIPTILFLALDTYYLASERGFRRSYNDFVEKLRSGLITPPDLYEVTPTGSLPSQFAASLLSFSIWPFYLMLVGVTALVSSLVIG